MEALQIAVKRRQVKSKGEKEIYKHLNAEFQGIARRDKKAFLSDQCKVIEENTRMGKTRDLFKKIRNTKGTFHAKNWLTGKDPDAGRDWGQEEKGTTEDEMAGWHHRLDGHEFEWTLRVGDWQRGLACCDSLGRKIGHDWVTELNWTEMVSDFYNLINLSPLCVSIFLCNGLIR